MQSRNIAIIGGLIIAIAIFAFGVPVFSVVIEEPYNETLENKVEVPFTDLEEIIEPLAEVEDRSIDSDRYLHFSREMLSGEAIIFAFFSSYPIDAYIFNEQQYLFWDTIGGDTALDKVSAKAGTLSALCSSPDTYYFVLANDNEISVRVDYELILGHKQEVTKYRTEIEYETVTKYRSVEKKVTLIDMLLHYPT
jgi:hypothetical protein